MANVYSIADAGAAGALAGSSCAFGVFDGLHLGHRFLIGETLRDSAERTCALTFDIDPDELFSPKRLRKLMTNESRIRALASSGVDAVVVLPFSPGFAQLSPQAFLASTFERAVPASMHVGSDVRFGKAAAGDVDALRIWGESAGCRVEPHALIVEDGAPVTATRIRALLEASAVEEANRLLGRPYVLEGTVVEGRHEGRDMGFRTANLQMPAMLQAIGEGVYAAYAHVGGARYKAAVSVGVAPTFAEEATATCEAHLLDFEGDIYGERISLEFRHWLRAMRKFDSVDELIATVMGNISWVREHL